MSRLLNPRGKFGNGAAIGPWTPTLANPQDRFDGAAAPPLAVGAAFFDDFDDFDTPTGYSSIAGRDGWTVDSAVFYTDDTMAATSGDGVLIGSYYGGNGLARFGAVCADQSEVQIAVRHGDPDKDESGAWNANYHSYYAWYDADSHIRLQLDPDNDRIQLFTRCAGVSSGNDTGRADLISYLPGGLAIPNGGNLTLSKSADARVRTYLGKVPLKPHNVYEIRAELDISTFITSDYREGQAAFFSANPLRYPLASSVGVRSGAAMFYEEALSHRAAGHSVIGGTTGQPDIAFTYKNDTGKTIAGWAMRLWDATEGDDPTTFNTTFAGVNAEGWKTVTPASNDGSSILFQTAMPDGYWLPEFAMVFDDGTYVSCYAHSVLVAKMVVYYGQSIAALRAAVPTNQPTPDPLAGVNAQVSWPVLRPYYPDNYIATAHDTIGYSTAYATWYAANGVVGLTDEPCIAVALGTGGSNLTALSVGGNNYDAFIATMDQMAGVPEVICFDHGQAQVVNPLAASGIPDYAANVQSGVIAPLRAKWGPGLVFILGMIGKWGSTTEPAGWTGDWEGFNAAVSALRLQIASLCTEYGGSDPLVHIGSFLTFIDYGDEDHPSVADSGNPALCMRDAHSISKLVYGADTHSSAGPFISGGLTRSGAVINVPIDLNGAVALSSESYTPTNALPNRTGTVWGWFVATDAAPGTPLTISSLDVGGDGESIDITLDAPPSGPCRVSLWHGSQWTDENAICGAYADGDPIPIQPSLDVANGRDYFLTAA